MRGSGRGWLRADHWRQRKCNLRWFRTGSVRKRIACLRWKRWWLLLVVLLAANPVAVEGAQETLPSCWVSMEMEGYLDKLVEAINGEQQDVQKLVSLGSRSGCGKLWPEHKELLGLRLAEALANLNSTDPRALRTASWALEDVENSLSTIGLVTTEQVMAAMRGSEVVSSSKGLWKTPDSVDALRQSTQENLTGTGNNRVSHRLRALENWLDEQAAAIQSPAPVGTDTPRKQTGNGDGGGDEACSGSLLIWTAQASSQQWSASSLVEVIETCKSVGRIGDVSNAVAEELAKLVTDRERGSGSVRAHRESHRQIVSDLERVGNAFEVAEASDELVLFAGLLRSHLPQSQDTDLRVGLLPASDGEWPANVPGIQAMDEFIEDTARVKGNGLEGMLPALSGLLLSVLLALIVVVAVILKRQEELRRLAREGSFPLDLSGDSCTGNQIPRARSELRDGQGMPPTNGETESTSDVVGSGWLKKWIDEVGEWQEIVEKSIIPPAKSVVEFQREVKRCMRKVWGGDLSGSSSAGVDCEDEVEFARYFIKRMKEAGVAKEIENRVKELEAWRDKTQGSDNNGEELLIATTGSSVPVGPPSRPTAGTPELRNAEPAFTQSETGRGESSAPPDTKDRVSLSEHQKFMLAEAKGARELPKLLKVLNNLNRAATAHPWLRSMLFLRSDDLRSISQYVDAIRWIRNEIKSGQVVPRPIEDAFFHFDPRRWCATKLPDLVDLFHRSAQREHARGWPEEFTKVDQAFREALALAGLKVIDIELGKTEFNSKIHEVRDRITDPSLPDNAITGCLRVGFLKKVAPGGDEKVWRKAQVQVNLGGVRRA